MMDRAALYMAGRHVHCVDTAKHKELAQSILSFHFKIIAKVMASNHYNFREKQHSMISSLQTGCLTILSQMPWSMIFCIGFL